VKAIQVKLVTTRESWRGLVKRLSDPGRKLRENQQTLDDLFGDLCRRFEDRLRQFKDRLGRSSGRLAALSPLAVLDRGYSLTYKLPEHTIVKDSSSVQRGDLVRVTFARGKAVCRVQDKE
jgi:exodeoxyribonuclease VII large subunit